MDVPSSENVRLGFYFADLIFVVCQSTAKTAKIGSLENFRLYGICVVTYVTYVTSKYIYTNFKIVLYTAHALMPVQLRNHCTILAIPFQVEIFVFIYCFLKVD